MEVKKINFKNGMLYIGFIFMLALLLAIVVITGLRTPAGYIFFPS